MNTSDSDRNSRDERLRAQLDKALDRLEKMRARNDKMDSQNPYYTIIITVVATLALVVLVDLYFKLV